MAPDRPKPDEVYSAVYGELFDELDVALETSSPDLLYDLAGRYLTDGAHILDVGCRDAAHLIELVTTHDATGVALDPVPWHLERAHRSIQASGLQSRIDVVEGLMEHLPFEDRSFDFIWCRDVLEVIPDLHPALAEAARVLERGGHLLVYTNFATERLSNAELNTFEQLGNSAASMRRDTFDEACEQAGLSLVFERVIGTEWREHEEPRSHLVSRDLLRLARLRRRQEHIVEKYGAAVYATAEASVQWSVSQFLGKIVPGVYVLTHHDRGDQLNQSELDQGHLTTDRRGGVWLT